MILEILILCSLESTKPPFGNGWELRNTGEFPNSNISTSLYVYLTPSCCPEKKTDAPKEPGKRYYFLAKDLDSNDLLTKPLEVPCDNAKLLGIHD